jgi:hypothetical protein
VNGQGGNDFGIRRISEAQRYRVMRQSLSRWT